MPALALVLSLVVLSHSGIFIRFCRADAAAIGFWRMAIAVPLLLAFLLARGQWGKVTGLRRAQWASLALCGFFLFSHWWTWFVAVQKTSLANSMVLFAISPLFTAVGAWFLYREPMTRRHAVALVFCFAGVAALFGGTLALEPAHLGGDLLGLLASILFSAYVLVSKGIRRQLDNLPFTVVTYSSSGLFFLVLMAARGIPFFGYDGTTWAAFFALAFGPTLTGHALFTWCLQFFNVNLMNILILTEPVIASASAYFIFQEPLTLHQAAGFALIACGVLALFMPLRRRRGA